MSRETTVLVVEDETHLAEGLLFNLRAEGYDAQLAADGETALAIIASTHIDAVILDVMLPGRDGFSVAAELRARQNYLPILMLTARGRPEDILLGFGAGADDYLAKPFDLSVLLARLRGLLRRMAWPRPELSPVPGEDAPADESPSSFCFAGRNVDFDSLELTGPDKLVRLTLMESDLLRYLVRNPGRIISRKELLEQVWRVREDTDTRAIDNFIVRLRRYIEDNPAEPVFLVTVRGIGYRFLPEAATDAGPIIDPKKAGRFYYIWSKDRNPPRTAAEVKQYLERICGVDDSRKMPEKFYAEACRWALSMEPVPAAPAAAAPTAEPPTKELSPQEAEAREAFSILGWDEKTQARFIESYKGDWNVIHGELKILVMKREQAGGH